MGFKPRTVFSSPALALAELRAFEEAHGPGVVLDDLPARLRRALRIHFVSIMEARSQAGIPPPTRPQIWDEATVLQELTRLSEQGVRITKQDLDRAGCYGLLGAIRRYVGTLHRARILAGIEFRPRPSIARHRWDEEAVVAEIKQRLARGESLNSNLVPSSLRTAACRYIGSWGEAIEAAGLDYDKIRRIPRYSDEDLLNQLRDFARAEPAATLTDVRRMPGCATTIERFGSIERAAKRAGLRDWPQRKRSEFDSRSVILRKLKARRRAGKPIYSHAVKLDDSHLHMSVIRTIAPFWDDAMVKLGFAPVSPNQTWSKEDPRETGEPKTSGAHYDSGGNKTRRQPPVQRGHALFRKSEARAWRAVTGAVASLAGRRRLFRRAARRVAHP